MVIDFGNCGVVCFIGKVNCYREFQGMFMIVLEILLKVV